MKTNKDLIPAFGLAIIVICLLALTVVDVRAEEPKHVDIAKQQLLEKEIEALAGKDSIILSRGKFIIEPFTCAVALADKKELRRILSSTDEYSEKRTKQYVDELSTVTSEIKKHKCEGKS